MLSRLVCDIFPDLVGRYSWGEVDFNDAATHILEVLGVSDKDPNPFLDPEFTAKWTNFVHKIKGIDLSWGGWMEDRAILWRGHYHEPGCTIHLGIDFNVPVGTVVHSPTDGEVVQSYVDPDQNGGWGGKVVLKTDRGFLLFGHLRNIPNTYFVGSQMKQGDVVGEVGDETCNGGWAPHLHVQAITGDLEFALNVDGYAKEYDEIEDDFPEPHAFLYKGR